jgi:hypothetical protein
MDISSVKTIEFLGLVCTDNQFAEISNERGQISLILMTEWFTVAYTLMVKCCSLSY